jgi:hypothetical protein
MDALIELVKIIIPAILVLYAVFLIVKSFLNKEFESKVLELRMKNTETVLPIRLQAYERMCLFLERISPNNLVLRLNDSGYTVREFQQVLLNDIRQEYNHNLSQQVYMSDESWNLTKKAMEEIVVVINTAAGNLDGEGSSLDLSKMIFEQMMGKNSDPVSAALTHMKDEIRQIF